MFETLKSPIVESAISTNFETEQNLEIKLPTVERETHETPLFKTFKNSIEVLLSSFSGTRKVSSEHLN